jgi:hypothetical protein
MPLDCPPVLRHHSSVTLAGTFNGFSPMSSGADRNRVALAMFESNQSLWRALGDFDNAGLAPEQLGVAGRASAISALVQAFHAGTSRPAHVQHLISGIAPLAVMAGQERLLASAGPLWPSLQCFGTMPDDALVCARWMTPRMRDELATHIVNGAILLGVRAASADQQKTCTQTLLQHSIHRVHTHEF